ncbi:LysM peptidoglycan-binding domain-containing protein [Candidatus Poribacteria bacterium]|nr:LysM peptidoglycan-binding domain-containing protein [Candidatus Poribacteria bacterium]
MPSRYEVVKGDSLWKIAGYEKIYGDPYKWPVIYKANKNQIKDPNIIYPYQILDIPRQLSKL